MQDGPVYNCILYISLFLLFTALQDSPVYNPSGYTQDHPAYNINLKKTKAKSGPKGSRGEQVRSRNIKYLTTLPITKLKWITYSKAGCCVDSTCTGCCMPVTTLGRVWSMAVLLGVNKKLARLPVCKQLSAGWGNAAGTVGTSPSTLSSFTSATGDRCMLFDSHSSSASGLLQSMTSPLPLVEMFFSSHCCIQLNPVLPVQLWPATEVVDTASALCGTESPLAASENLLTFGALESDDAKSATVWPSANNFGGGTISSQSSLKRQAIFDALWWQRDENSA